MYYVRRSSAVDEPQREVVLESRLHGDEEELPARVQDRTSGVVYQKEHAAEKDSEGMLLLKPLTEVSEFINSKYPPLKRS